MIKKHIKIRHLLVWSIVLVLCLSNTVFAQDLWDVSVRTKDLSSSNNIVLGKDNQNEIVHSTQRLNFKYNFEMSFDLDLDAKYSEGFALVFHNDKQGDRAKGDGLGCLAVYQCQEQGQLIDRSIVFEVDLENQFSPIHNTQTYGQSDTQFTTQDNIHYGFTRPEAKTEKHYGTSELSKQSYTGKDTITLEWHADKRILSYSSELGMEGSIVLNDQDINNLGESAFLSFASTINNPHSKVTNVNNIVIQQHLLDLEFYIEADGQKLYHTAVDPNQTGVFMMDVHAYENIDEALVYIPKLQGIKIESIKVLHDKTGIKYDEKLNQATLNTLSQNETYTLVFEYKSDGLSQRIEPTIKVGILDKRIESNALTIMPYDLMNVQYQSGQYSDVMPEDIKQIYGSFVEIAEPLNTKIDQYYFTYWSTQKDGSGIRYYPGQKIRLTQHHTLYAQWSTDVKKMQIDFNRTANDTVKTYWMNQAQGFNLDMIRPQYPGYQLVSFNTQKDGSGLVYQLDDIIHSKDNLVLYAQWETMDYLSIQFDTLGQGELLGKSHYQLAANTVLGMNPQVRAYGNKRFVGWMLNGLQVDLNTFEIKENHTFEALYEDKNLNYYFDEVHREKGSQRIEVSFDFGVYAKPTIVRQNYTEGMPVQVPLSVRLPRDVKLIGFELDGKAIQLDTLKASEGLYLTAVYGEKDSEVLDKTLLNYKPIPELNESRSRLSRAGVIKVLLLLIAALLIIVDGVRKIRLRRRTHESSR